MHQDPEAPKPEHAAEGGERPGQAGLRLPDFAEAFPVEDQPRFTDEVHRKEGSQRRREDQQDEERDRRGFRGEQLPRIDGDGDPVRSANALNAGARAGCRD